MENLLNGSLSSRTLNNCHVVNFVITPTLYQVYSNFQILHDTQEINQIRP